MKIGALVLTTLLAGCTLGPDYKRPDMPLPTKFPDQPASGEPAAAPLPSDWWMLYNDATLSELVTSGRKSNADVRLAFARVQEAEGVLREARASLFPEVIGTASYARTGVSTFSQPPVPAGITTVRPSYQAILSTSYEVDFWGRVSRGNEAARASLLATRLSRDVVDITLAGGIAQTYFVLRSLDTQIAVLDNSIRVRRESLDIAKARLEAGLAPELDVYQAQGALSDALVQRRDAARSRSLVEHQLAQLTGRLDLQLRADKLAGDVFSLPLVPLPPPGMPSTLLDRRPDIRQAEETLVAANAQIGIARAALFPTISLTASAGVQSAQFADLLAGPGAKIWSLGAALAGPIFDAGRRDARVDQARARNEQALATYQKAIETGFREVADALVNVEQSGESEAELKARLDAARSALELSTLRYQSGYSPYLEVLDAQRTANDAELAFVRNRQARLAFSVDLMKALGGGWDPAAGR
ncbi:MAG: efflux transporter outer membrane subunit [Betaproteobacteria bacterium]|nr:efflux transporter outer membrane subunit [Betaproteobacteria bacterium]